MESLIGKVAIITGGSRGIGRAIALEMARNGANIVITYSKDEEGAMSLVEEVKAIGSDVLVLKKDGSDYNNCKDIISETMKHYGRLDILVNNAGISTVGLFMDSTKEDIDNMINNNLLSMMYLSKIALPHLIDTKGKILNISSIWGEVGASCEVLYSVTKGGINLLTKALAKEMALSGVRVNAIAPGVIDTKMNSFLSIEERKDLEEEIPMGRFGDPQEVAKTAVFLCSEDSSYITGQIIKVDGAFL